MNSGRLTDSLRCQHCGKQLQPCNCYECGGKGTTKYLLLFSRTCQNCNGSGIIYKCPDGLEHLMAIQAKITSKLKGIKPFDTKPQSERKCWVCGGTGRMIKRKHIPRPTDLFPNYPRVYMEQSVRCTKCNGHGWLE